MLQELTMCQHILTDITPALVAIPLQCRMKTNTNSMHVPRQPGPKGLFGFGMSLYSLWFDLRFPVNGI